MIWSLPGTTIQADRAEADGTAAVFRSMYLAGDMALGQVAGLSGLEPYIIQNWVKRGFLSPPRAKRYSLNQLCRILNINMLKGALPMDRICGLLTYINGQLDDESDDLIDDAELYFIFVKLAARTEQMRDPVLWKAEAEKVLSDHTERRPGANDRIADVLQIMLTAWVSANLRLDAERMLAQLNQEAAV